MLPMTRKFWKDNCGKSGQQIARELQLDPGNTRREIRRAKGLFKDLPWRTDPRHVSIDECVKVCRGDLVQPPPGPAILIYDIETAPGLAWVWGAYDQNAIAMEQDWYMLSFAYKWLNKPDVGFVSIFQDPGFAPDTTDDFYVAERLAALFDMADVIVAHNGDKFDRRKANQRFLKWGIDPPSPYQSIDTKKAVCAEFSHYSNSLNELSRLHGFGEKEHHTGFELWRECMAGNASFWKVMEKYNRQDVLLLEKLYVKLLPWIGNPGRKGHPNHGHWHDGQMVCPKCGHDKLTRHGTYRTSVSSYPTFRCERCRGICRSRKRIESGVDVV